MSSERGRKEELEKGKKRERVESKGDECKVRKQYVVT